MMHGRDTGYYSSIVRDTKFSEMEIALTFIYGLKPTTCML